MTPREYLINAKVTTRPFRQVPLIVSEESGVYQLITELFGEAGLVRPVKIGSPH